MKGATDLYTQHTVSVAHTYMHCSNMRSVFLCVHCALLTFKSRECVIDCLLWCFMVGQWVCNSSGTRGRGKKGGKRGVRGERGEGVGGLGVMFNKRSYEGWSKKVFLLWGLDNPLLSGIHFKAYVMLLLSRCHLICSLVPFPTAISYWNEISMFDRIMHEIK